MKKLFIVLFLLSSPIYGQDDIQFQLDVLSSRDKSFYAVRRGEKFLWDLNFVRLEFIFSASDSIPLLFDYRTFCVSCKFKKYSFSENLDSTTTNLINSELIIENKINQFRLFTTTRNVKDRYKDIQTQFYGCGWALPDEPCEDIYELTGEKPVKFKIDILVNDLKIQDTDKEIRLHYVFKPTERQKKLGFTQSFILTSNWIKLTE